MDALKRLFDVKVNSNPENNLGVMTNASKS